MEPLTCYLSSGIRHTVRGISYPLVSFTVCVICNDAHLSPFSHRLFVPFYLHGSHHGLAGVAKATWRTVVENVPLSIYLLQGTMCIMPSICADKVCAIFIGDNTT